jgi:putative transposase
MQSYLSPDLIVSAVSMVTCPSGLVGVTEEERARALARFQALRPFLQEGTPLAQIAARQGITLRTARRWVKQYRSAGLAGLGRKVRADKNRRRISASLQHLIEGLALQSPAPSVATVFRRIVAEAARIKEPIPSYRTVCAMIREIDPALKALAHEGTKSYSDTFDLLYRTEASGPNAIWQADHTELDILVLDESKRSRKPWLTVILDDHSRAVAGYLLSFSAPSALQTALALRQAIWRKSQPGWDICGIPQILYTDHGSDFTSQHLEQVAADLKIQLVFSTVGKPRGRGKVERFFETVNQVLLSRLPGYAPAGAMRKAKAVLSLPQLREAFEDHLLREYHTSPHSATGESPQVRWRAGGFLPQMPASLEQLDLLLLTVPRTRRVHQDGIRFMGLRYISPTLAAYVGEEVLLRFDPRDMAEVRLFHDDRFLCRAICQEIAGETLTLREIVRARDQRRRQLQQTLQERQRTVESLLEARRWSPLTDTQQSLSQKKPPPSAPRLKRYFND